MILTLLDIYLFFFTFSSLFRHQMVVIWYYISACIWSTSIHVTSYVWPWIQLWRYKALHLLFIHAGAGLWPHFRSLWSRERNILHDKKKPVSLAVTTGSESLHKKLHSQEKTLQDKLPEQTLDNGSIANLVRSYTNFFFVWLVLCVCRVAANGNKKSWTKKVLYNHILID